MRKLTIVALALVLVALVWWIARGLTVSRSSSTTVAIPDTRETVARGSDAIEAEASKAADAKRATIAPPVLPTTVGDLSAARGCRIRVHVAFDAPKGFEPNYVAVRALDTFDADRPVQRLSATEYLVSDLPTGTYSVQAREGSSMNAVEHVSLAKPGEERVVELRLQPVRVVRVHWRSPDGRPILTALRGAGPSKSCRVLAVHATVVPLQRGDPEPSLLSLGTFRVDIDGPKGSVKQSDVVDAGREEDDEPDVFCTLDIATPNKLWISTGLCGEVLDCQELPPGRTDIVFTNLVDELSMPLVPISLCAVDDVTGEPVTNVAISTEGIGHHYARTNEHGCAVVEVEPGWSLIWLDQESDVATVTPMESRLPSKGGDPTLAGRTFRVRAEKGRPIDLGMIRFARARRLQVRVLDSSTMITSKAQVMLMPARDYDGTGLAFSSKGERTNDRGIASFQVAADQSYVVTAEADGEVSDPIVIDASIPPDGTGSIACDVLMKPARHVAFLFKSSPHPGTRLLVETLAGLLVHDAEVSEFGVSSVDVSGDDYSVHLVEDGAPKPAVRIRVTSEPFIVEM